MVAADPRPAGPGSTAGEENADAGLVASVDRTLADYLQRRRTEIEPLHPAFTEATGALAEFVLGGGKRIRPAFAWWGWRGAGGHPDGELTSAVLGAISALELVQASALVHDDLMDDSDTRRGRPTVHVAFADRHHARSWLGPSERFGRSVAVLLGDLALTWADDMFADAGLPSDMARRARPAWRAMRTEVLGGQFLDVWCQATGDETVDAALRIDRYKTAAYTVERPLQLGAALAGAPPETVAAYRRFGADIGVAFQLRDDVLGVFGDPLVTGKPAGDDLREGKRTLLLALALRRARAAGDTASVGVLTDAVGNGDLDAEGVARAREVLIELGAVRAVEEWIDQLTSAAHTALGSVELAEPAPGRLIELFRTATQRQH